MSWSIEEHIGEGRPWPEQVVVYRGETDESLTYARRSLSDVNQMVELMDTLAAENAKLRELVRDVYTLHWNGLDCTECPWFDECDTTGGCPWLSIFADRMRELGVD